MSAGNLLVRRATSADSEVFLELVVALAEFEKLDPPDAEAQQRLLEDAFGERPRIEVWLAGQGEASPPAGYAIFLETYSSFLARPTLYIEDIFVRPEFRRRGLGGALLRKAVELARDRACGRVEWTALDWNVNAQRIYDEKLGARRMSEWILYRMARPDMVAYLQKTPPP